MAAPFGAGGVVLADDTVDGERHEVQIQSADAAEIDEALREDADEGTVEVVVRMSAERSSRARPVAADSASPAELKRAARSTQSAFDSYAEDTDGVEVKSEFWIANAVVAEVDTGEVPLEELAKVDGVVRVHPNYEVELQRAVGADAAASQPQTSPSVAATSGGYQTTYGIEAINATAVWDAYDTRGKGAKVAVLDTGVDPDHPDIDLYTEDPTNESYPGGWAEFDGSGDRVEGSVPDDPHGHGTHVSGTVAGGNASGTHIGVAPDAKLMHGQVLESDGSGRLSQIIAGIEWAVEEDADVVTMSLGINGYYSDFIDPIRNARASGTVVVASIGNDGEGNSSSPGNVYDTLSVGAIDSTDDVADFSGGEEIDTDAAWKDPPDDWPDQYVVPNVAAPGVDVYSAYPDDQYAYLDGTSMAAPHVAGAAALVVSASPSRPTPGEIDAAFEESARKPAGEPDGADTRYGHGIVDVYAASLGSLNGTVTASGATAQTAGGGDPIANATVTVYDDGAEIANTTTDADGAYALGGVETGNHTVEFDHEDFAAEQRDVRIDPGELTTEDAALDYAEAGTITGELELTAPTKSDDVAVTVTATDADGEAANETVSIPAGETGGTYELTVDVNVEEGYSVSAVADDYHENVTDVGEVGVGETVEANLTLTARESSVTGTVTASGVTAGTAGGGDPIESATVTVSENGTHVANVTTDADGEYAVTGLAPADYRVVADAESFVSEEWSGWVDPNATETAEFELDYAEGGDIAGRVTGGEDTDAAGEGLDNLTVTVTADDGTTRSTTTNATGHYEVADLDVDVDEDDAYAVTVDGGGTYRNGTAENVTVEPGERSTASFALPYAPGTIAGEVTLAVPTDGGDVAVTVAATNDDGVEATETVTVPAGETVAAYELTVGVDREGGYVLEAGAEGYEPAGVDAGTVDPGERVEGVDATLAAENATVSGTVTASGATDGITAQGTESGSGEPVESATVTVYDGTGTELGTATTSEDGTYAFGPLRPDETHTVEMDHENYTATERSVAPDPGENASADVALDYAEGGTIAGTVELDVVDPEETVTVTVVADDGEHRYATDVVAEGEASTAEYALEGVAVDVDSGYEVVATTDAAYANGSVAGVEVWVNETVEGVDPTAKREPGSLGGVYEVNVTGTNAPVEVDETLTVDANVTNVGDRGYRNVSLTVEADDGTVVGNDRVVPLLEAGENGSVTLEWPASVDAGEYTARVATADDADNVTVTVESASVAGGGGGGGGMPPSGDGGDDWPEPTRQAVQAVSDAEPDAPGITMRFEGTSVEEIVFSSEESGGAIAQVSVDEVDDLPANTPALPEQARAVSVSRITVPDAYRDSPATLRMRVGQERLDALDADPEELTVYRLPDGADEWQPLETAVSETDDGVVLEFETPGFSAFAVAQQQRQQEERTSTPTPTPTPIDVEDDPAPTSTDTDTEETPTSGDDDGPGVMLIGLLVVVVLAIAGGAVYYSTLRERED